MSRTKTKLKMRDYVGRFVRLTRDIDNLSTGEHCPAGTVYRCRGTTDTRLKLELPHAIPMVCRTLRLSPRFADLVTGRHCKECGCTEADCRGCVERTGEPCTWVGPNLCSACASESPTEQ